MPAQDNMNCLKNLMQLMCCDGVIDEKEKAFLYRAAEHLAVSVDDWNALLKEVLGDNIPFYPVSDREKAVAALKAMIVMAQADGQVDEKEKQFALHFAKSMGVNRSEWKELLKSIDTEHLFAPFQLSPGSLIALTDDFEKLEAFLEIAGEYGTVVRTTDLKSHLQTAPLSQTIVCFHAAPEKDLSVARCQLLLKKNSDHLVCILNRFQGHQVKYLHEAGLKKCVIEP
ncbi:MAG: TerB family tellurite resistance protein, partial [Planctomycetes bacterium]|nr:TerB family tellurite resistance protein [Planctomycetota bacterium]